MVKVPTRSGEMRVAIRLEGATICEFITLVCDVRHSAPSEGVRSSVRLGWAKGNGG